MKTKGPLTNSERFETLKLRDKAYQKEQDKLGQK